MGDDRAHRVAGAVIAHPDDLDRARHAIAVYEPRRMTDIDPVDSVAGPVQINGDEVHDSVLRKLAPWMSADDEVRPAGSDYDRI